MCYDWLQNYETLRGKVLFLIKCHSSCIKEEEIIYIQSKLLFPMSGSSKHISEFGFGNAKCQ
jgi:hypothetical protein